MSNTPRFGFAIEYVKDIETATRFYANVVGLKVERTAPNFVQFEHFALATDEPLAGKPEIELYWLVDDAEAAVSALAQSGSVSMPLKQMPFGKVFGVTDPDGQPRYVLELAASRPSEPTDARAAQPAP